MSLIHPSSVGSSDLIARIKAILTDPKSEWDRIDTEPATVGSLYTAYIMILAAIPPLARLIHGVVFGYGGFGFSYRPSIPGAVAQAVVSYGLNLAVIFIVALIIDALATNFGGQKSQIQALKVAAFASTASWIAGAFDAVPFLGILALLGALYSLYLLYLGLPRLMKAPQDQALGYTAVTIVVAIVMSVVVYAVAAAVAMPFGGFGGGVFSRGGQVAGTLHLPGGASVNIEQLNAASKQAEIAAAQIKAQENGQPPPPGAVKAVDPSALKALLPDSVAGYPRTEVSAEGEATAGLAASSASATYAKGDSHISLQLTDMAASGAIAAMGAAMNVESSRETATGYEKIGKVDGRLTTEDYDRQSQHGKYAVMVASRFMVEAAGDHVSMDELKAAVSSVGLGRLEGMAHNS
jgi:hypothetical protein